MANKHLLPEKSTLFKNKLAKIQENIQRVRETNSLQTKEAYIQEAVRLLATFYRTVSESNFLPNEARSGTTPVLEDYNENLNMIKDDLDILFLELENVEGVVLENFNLFAAHSNRLNSRVKRLGSQVTDYALFSKLPIKNSIFFSDSFSDLSKVEPNSSLVNGSECEINQVEGVLTLPIDRSSTETLEINEDPLINSNSNGRRGNNEQLGSALNDEISVMFDNNPDTWFEYEKVDLTDDKKPLVLDFTVNLTDLQILNFIRINPNNFGTRTEIEIVDISTSADGNLYTSIKDDIPIAGFLVEDEENVFALAPSTSKFAGQGLYTFTPRYAKYIRIILRQSSPYLINTNRGPQVRYAIGIRDIEVQRQAYEAAGEVVSQPFQTSEEIKKVALQSSQTPVVASELAEVRHQVSFDDGNTWNDINPLEDDGFINVASTAPEILNVNTEDENSVITDNPAFTVRYKALLSRNNEGFTEGSTAFAEQIVDKVELKNVPNFQPWFFELDNAPLVGSVSVIDPSYGSRGKPDVKYLVGKGTGNRLMFTLPFTLEQLMETQKQYLTVSQVYKINEQVPSFTVQVDGQEWTAVADLSTYSQDSIVYTYDVNENGTVNLNFGDGTNGLSPPQGANIEIIFTSERLFPVGKDNHKSPIEFNTSIDKSLVTIQRLGTIVANVVEAGKDKKRHVLENREIVTSGDYNITFTPSTQTVFVSEVSFVNGNDELNSTGEYSIDRERGIIYSYDRVGENELISIKYFYQALDTLPETFWDWGDEDALHSSIEIKDSAWSTNPVINFSFASGVNKIGLPNLCVIEGSVEFFPPAGVDLEDEAFLQEVEFFDGQSELREFVKREENISALNPIGNVATFVTKTQIAASNLNYNVGFDDITIFTNEVATVGDVLSVGDYHIDTTTNTITVHTDGATVSRPGKIYYWSRDPDSIPPGAYSIDYRNGEIYTQRPVFVNGYSVNYEYANYIIKYNIARAVPEEDWDLDPSLKTITIKSNEVLRKAGTPSITGTETFTPQVYQVNYKFIKSVRQNIAALAPYFSPVLKDYALQVITKGFI